MRKLILPIALLVLAGCGAKDATHASEDPKNAALPPSKVWPVTEEMKTGAATVVGRVMPAMATKDATGKTVDLASLDPKRKILFYAINKDCPCCVTATPLINQLATNPDAPIVIGMLLGTPSEAEAWNSAHQPKFPVIPVWKEITDTLGMKAGVYMTLIGLDRKVEKVYPGYSKNVLNEIAKADWKDAPDDETSGCDFEMVNKKDNGLGR